MFINEAIMATTADEPYITRKAWRLETGFFGSKIMPTNTPDCCIARSSYGRGPRRGWEPLRCDLMADDWITTK